MVDVSFHDKQRPQHLAADVQSHRHSNEVCAAVESKLKLLGTKDWQTQKRRERCVFTVLFLLVGGVAALL
jgi:hypothetical protein